MPRYLHTATLVIPANSVFPIDMLRYDTCWPATQDDVAKFPTEREDRPIQLDVQTVSDRKTGAFTVERWRSFGIRVTRVDTRRI